MKILKRIIQIALLLIVIYFLCRSVISNWSKIEGYNWSFDIPMMVLSIALYYFGYAFLPWILCRMFGYMGYKMSYADVWDIFYVGSLGKYVPGKVWAIAGMTYMAEKSGVPVQAAGTAVVFAQVYSLLASVLFFIIFLFLRGLDSSSSFLLWFLPAGAMLVVFIFPKNLERFINLMLARIGRKPLVLGINSLSAIKVVFFYLISWIVFGAAFWAMAVAVSGNVVFDPVMTMSAYVIANVVGFLAFFAPGGVGVREAVLGLLFSGVVPVSVGIVIAVLSRLIVTFIEIINIFITLIRKGFSYGYKKTG